MTDETNARSFSDIWSIKDEIVEKNKSVKAKVFDIPDEDLVANNVSGVIINSLGNIVAKFGFFIETEGKDRIDVRVSPDGFLGVLYNRPANIILGYGHPLGFAGLVDPAYSNVICLSEEQRMNGDIIISIENDEKFVEQGIVCIMRDVDVMVDILSEEVRDDYARSLADAAEPVTDLNEIEASFNAYLKNMYEILGQDISQKGEQEKKEEIHE